MMLEWLQATYADTAKRLKAVEVERARLQGGLAALEAAIAQARKEAGGGNGAAPAGRVGIPITGPNGQNMLIMADAENPRPGPAPAVQGVQEMMKVPHGPVQADQELRE